PGDIDPAGRTRRRRARPPGGERGALLLAPGRGTGAGRTARAARGPGRLSAPGGVGRPDRLNVLVSLCSYSGRSTSIDFRPLNDPERRQLTAALRGNAENDRAILMDRRDTSFLGTADEVTDEEVIFAIKSVPCHY